MCLANTLALVASNANRGSHVNQFCSIIKIKGSLWLGLPGKLYKEINSLEWSLGPFASLPDGFLEEQSSCNHEY